MSTRKVAFALAGTATGALLLIGAKGSLASTSSARSSTGSRPAALASGGSGAKPAAGTYSVTGPVEMTPFGPVQVKVDIVSGKIGDAVAVQTPTAHGFSIELNKYATPILRSETLRAQDANIDVVSGATYTSDAYAQSLRAALDAAAKHAAR